MTISSNYHFFVRHLTLYGVRVICLIAIHAEPGQTQVTICPAGWNQPLNLECTYPAYISLSHSYIVDAAIAKAEAHYRDTDEPSGTSNNIPL